jgi:hypothetical protein
VQYEHLVYTVIGHSQTKAYAVKGNTLILDVGRGSGMDFDRIVGARMVFKEQG